MGAQIKGFEKAFEKSPYQAYTVDKMSTTIVRILEALSKDEEIFKLLYYTDANALKKNISDDNDAKKVFEEGLQIKNKSEFQKIRAYPFNPTPAEEQDISIRVYYSNGSFTDSNVYSRNQLTIDIICSHDVWLTSDNGTDGNIKLIRPYALMRRVNDVLQSLKMDKLPVPTGYSHLTVNSVFECIRIYAKDVAIEKDGGNSDFS